MKHIRKEKNPNLASLMINTTVMITVKSYATFNITVDLEPIRSIINPCTIPPIISPAPKATMPNKAFETFSLCLI